MTIETKHFCEPAYSVCDRLGGKAHLARVLGLDISTLSRWCTPKDQGGTGGFVPQKYWRPILSYAKKRGTRMDLVDLSGIGLK